MRQQQTVEQANAVEPEQSRWLRPWIGDPPRSTPPVVDGYRLRAHMKFDMIQGSIAGMVLLPFWFVFYTVLVGALGGRYFDEFAVTLPDFALGIVIALVAVPLLHEAVHGLAAMLFGIRPSYGIGPGFAYTTFPDPLGKRAYLAVGLAPLVVLSLIGVPLAVVWDAGAGAIIFFLIVNAAGAIGDLWMSWRIMLQPANARFVDLADGFAVYVPEGDSTA